MSFLLFAAVVPYLIPTGVAAYRDHADKNAIFLINLLLGWTIIGWIAALVWAFSGTPGVQRIEALGDEVRPGGLKLQGRDPRFDAGAQETTQQATPRSATTRSATTRSAIKPAEDRLPDHRSRP